MAGSVKVSVDLNTHRKMLEGTVGAMLFSGLDENEKHSGISIELLNTLRSDCAVFLYLLSIVHSGRMTKWSVQQEAKRRVFFEPERAGADLWLTRAGAGCGFWDGDWDEPGEHEVGDYLKWLANLIPQVEVYVGDDGYIYGTW